MDQHYGIENLKVLIKSSASIMCDAIGIVKGGIGFSALPKGLHLLGEVKELISSAPGAIPEFKDLDPQESAELGELSYNCAVQIISAVKG